MCLLASVVVAQVQEEEIPSDDPVIEQRLANLSKELRCLQCQNQTLAESNAPLAKDLRDKIYTLIKDQQSDTDITAFLTQRYGTFIFMRPPVNYATLALWLAPLLIFFLTIAFLVL